MAILAHPEQEGASTPVTLAEPADPADGQARAQRATPAAGLVRLETSATEREQTATFSEEMRVAVAHRRALRVFKSLSCAGDLMRTRKDSRGRVLQGWFLTLTYRPEVDWQAGQIAVFRNLLDQWHRRRGIKLRLLWVAEQHKSGRVHYHCIVFLRRDLALPKPDKQGWWAHGMSQRQKLRKQSVGYLIKYATKGGSVTKPWPKGLRLSGFAGLEAAERIRRAWWVLPKYIREQCEDWQRVRRAQGGGWTSPETGEWWPAWTWGAAAGSSAAATT